MKRNTPCPCSRVTNLTAVFAMALALQLTVTGGPLPAYTLFTQMMGPMMGPSPYASPTAYPMQYPDPSSVWNSVPPATPLTIPTSEQPSSVPTIPTIPDAVPAPVVAPAPITPPPHAAPSIIPAPAQSSSAMGMPSVQMSSAPAQPAVMPAVQQSSMSTAPVAPVQLSAPTFAVPQDRPEQTNPPPSREASGMQNATVPLEPPAHIVPTSLWTEKHLAAPAFTDVPDSHPYKDAINQAVEMGIFSGKPNNKFDPDGTLTRAELAKIVTGNASDIDRAYCAALPSQFKDIPEDAWYKVPACLAKMAGLMNGEGNGDFAGGKPVTLGAMAKVLVNAHLLTPEENAGPEWFSGPMAALEKAGAIAHHMNIAAAQVPRGQSTYIIIRVSYGLIGPDGKPTTIEHPSIVTPPVPYMPVPSSSSTAPLPLSASPIMGTSSSR